MNINENLINTLELKIARARKGVTQEDVARELSISRQAYYLKEKGKRPFNMNEVKKLQALLNLVQNAIINIFFPNTSFSVM